MDDLSTVPREDIIDYLLDRLQKGEIYTWVGGTILLAINPSGEIFTENIYDLSKVDEYKNICGLAYKETVPHIFAVAAGAQYKVIHCLGLRNQVIVLNGETGAGKTFNAWKVFEFLTASSRIASSNTQKQDTCDIVQRITSACSLISAFTTAPTERNEDSSRHVQLMWLEYRMGRLCGAKICSYLLERNRVTKNCYCNFRILVQMTLDSDNKLKDTLQAMDVLNFTADQKKNILEVLSLLLYMNDIQFIQEDDHCTIDTDNKQSRKALKNTCKMACLEEEDISKLLTSILIRPQNIWRGQPECRRNLNTINACHHRLHSIIRHLYDLLFQWLINTVNNFLSAQFFSERLGILDIFGFECFNKNGIEQLCINYVNERLQQYFVEKYIEFHRKVLQKEGLIDESLIDEEHSEMIVQLYKDRLNTIEKLLFTTINDLCLSTVPNNSSTLIQQIQVNSSPAMRRFLKVENENFVIQHYAGAVEYSVNNLLSKNIDKIPDEIIKTFELSKNKFLYELITQIKIHDDGKIKKPTVLSKLRYNVNLLIQELDNCEIHYVRCIKPRRLTNLEWDRDKLYEQLANAGILDALPLAGCKYSIYLNYTEFVERYSMRYDRYSYLIKSKLVEEFGIIMDNYLHYGKYLVFLTESLFLKLEAIRRQLHIKSVKKIESFWIKHRSSRRQNVNDTNIENVDVSTTTTYKLLEFYVDKFNSQFIQNQLRDMKTCMPMINSTIILSMHKNSRIIQWLDDINKEIYIQNTEFSISEQLSTSHDCNEIINTNNNQNILSQHSQHTNSNRSNLHKRGINQMDSENYNKQNINKKMNVQKSEFSISEQPTSHDCNQFISTDNSQNIPLQHNWYISSNSSNLNMQDIEQVDSEDYNKQDMHKKMDIQNIEFLIPEQLSTCSDCNRFINDLDSNQDILSQLNDTSSNSSNLDMEDIDQLDSEDYNKQDMHKKMDIQNIEFSISEQPSTSHDFNRFIDIDSIQNILSQYNDTNSNSNFDKQGIDEVDFGDYNKQDMHKEMDVQNTEFSIPEQPSTSHDCNQFINTNCSQNILSQHNRHTSSNSDRRHKQSKYQMNFGDHNKDKDVYIIQHGTSTLFYKDKILSRRRPAKVPIKVHTRLTCLTNSHYMIHTELPQGLQDCL